MDNYLKVNDVCSDSIRSGILPSTLYSTSTVEFSDSEDEYEVNSLIESVNCESIKCNESTEDSYNAEEYAIIFNDVEMDEGEQTSQNNTEIKNFSIDAFENYLNNISSDLQDSDEHVLEIQKGRNEENTEKQESINENNCNEFLIELYHWTGANDEENSGEQTSQNDTENKHFSVAAFENYLNNISSDLQDLDEHVLEIQKDRNEENTENQEISNENNCKEFLSELYHWKGADKQENSCEYEWNILLEDLNDNHCEQVKQTSNQKRKLSIQQHDEIDYPHTESNPTLDMPESLMDFENSAINSNMSKKKKLSSANWEKNDCQNVDGNVTPASEQQTTAEENCADQEMQELLNKYSNEKCKYSDDTANNFNKETELTNYPQKLTIVSEQTRGTSKTEDEDVAEKWNKILSSIGVDVCNKCTPREKPSEANCTDAAFYYDEETETKTDSLTADSIDSNDDSIKLLDFDWCYDDDNENHQTETSEYENLRTKTSCLQGNFAESLNLDKGTKDKTSNSSIETVNCVNTENKESTTEGTKLMNCDGHIESVAFDAKNAAAEQKNHSEKQVKVPEFLRRSCVSLCNARFKRTQLNPSGDCCEFCASNNSEIQSKTTNLFTNCAEELKVPQIVEENAVDRLKVPFVHTINIDAQENASEAIEQINSILNTFEETTEFSDSRTKTPDTSSFDKCTSAQDSFEDVDDVAFNNSCTLLAAELSKNNPNNDSMHLPQFEETKIESDSILDKELCELSNNERQNEALINELNFVLAFDEEDETSSRNSQLPLNCATEVDAQKRNSTRDYEQLKDILIEFEDKSTEHNYNNNNNNHNQIRYCEQLNTVTCSKSKRSENALRKSDLENPVEKFAEEREEIENIPTHGILLRNALSEFASSFQQNENVDRVARTRQTAFSENDRTRVLQKIENVMQGVTEAVKQKRALRFYVANRETWENCVIVDDRVTLKSSDETKKTIISYSSKKSKAKFELIVYILNEIYNLLLNNKTVSRREIYYENCHRIKSQCVIDRAVMDISRILDTPPWELGITSSGKGLVFGNLIIKTQKEEIDCSIQGGVLIPQNVNEIVSVTTNAQFILVIEKDACFQKFLDDKVEEKLKCSIIMITGKGYPDINTRYFLNRLSNIVPLPIFALTDGDPHGIDIMLTYRFGSKELAHLSQYLAVPKLKWLGIHPRDINKYQMKTKPLTDIDKRKAQKMLERPYIEMIPKIRQQIEILIATNVKSELEGFDNKEFKFLTELYMSSQIFNNFFF